MPKRETTKQKHLRVAMEVTALQKKRINGMAFSLDSIMEKVAEKYSLSPLTVRDIHRKTKTT